jgi:hypothetical protein
MLDLFSWPYPLWLIDEGHFNPLAREGTRLRRRKFPTFLRALGAASPSSQLKAFGRRDRKETPEFHEDRK